MCVSRSAVSDSLSPRSPALQADSLPSELPGNCVKNCFPLAWWQDLCLELLGPLDRELPENQIKTEKARAERWRESGC